MANVLGFAYENGVFCAGSKSQKSIERAPDRGRECGGRAGGTWEGGGEEGGPYVADGVFDMNRATAEDGLLGGGAQSGEGRSGEHVVEWRVEQSREQLFTLPFHRFLACLVPGSSPCLAISTVLTCVTRYVAAPFPYRSGVL